MCHDCLGHWRQSFLTNEGPQTPVLCPHCRGYLCAEDMEEEQAYQVWKALCYVAHLRNAPPDVRDQ